MIDATKLKEIDAPSEWLLARSKAASFHSQQCVARLLAKALYRPLPQSISIRLGDALCPSSPENLLPLDLSLRRLLNRRYRNHFEIPEFFLFSIVFCFLFSDKRTQTTRLIYAIGRTFTNDLRIKKSAPDGGLNN